MLPLFRGIHIISYHIMSVNQTGYWRAGKIVIMPFQADFTERSGGRQLPCHSVGDLQHLQTHLLLQCLLYIVLGEGRDSHKFSIIEHNTSTTSIFVYFFLGKGENSKQINKMFYLHYHISVIGSR